MHAWRLTEGLFTRVFAQNFVVANAIETILAQPKRPVAEPPPTSKKDYGQVPQYLQKIKKEIEKEKKIVAEYVKQQARATGLVKSRQPPEWSCVWSQFDSKHRSGCLPPAPAANLTGSRVPLAVQEEASQTHRIMPEDEKCAPPH